jgi:Rrf2 family nitric oxide-sensitive transcriptional repressor
VPDKIRIGEVVRFTEGRFTPVECFRDDNQCVITPACFLPAILNEAFRSFTSTLDRYTLADLLVRRAQLDALLSAPARPHRGRGVRVGRRPSGRIAARSR